MKLKPLKKFLSAAAALILSATVSIPAFADNSSSTTYSQLSTTYSNNYVLNNKQVDSNDLSIETAPGSSSSSSSSNKSTYYYDTGTNCPEKAAYGKTYNLVNKVKKGDIIYEAAGGFGITGHIAIVEGIYYSKTLKRNYIRIIEAIDKGVKRGILDDTRMKEKKVTILRVKNANSQQINGAVSFSRSQLNKKYKLDLKKNTKKSEKDWYCSELVWASYKNQGIDIETTGKINEPGITPRDILRSSKVKTILTYK